MTDRATLPTDAGWYWVEDAELVIGSPWCLAFFNPAGDRYSEGKPMMVMFEPASGVGMPSRYTFFWDGADWLCPEDPSAVTEPLRFVRAEFQGEMTDG